MHGGMDLHPRIKLAFIFKVVKSLLPEASERGDASSWSNKDAWDFTVLWHVEDWGAKRNVNFKLSHV